MGKKKKRHMDDSSSEIILDDGDHQEDGEDEEDAYIELDGALKDNVQMVEQLHERPIWAIHALLVLCAVVALSLVGVECAFNAECNAAIPTLDYLIRSGNRLSILVVLAINWVTALHGLTAFILWFLFRRGQRSAGRMQLFLAVAFQISVYAALLLADYWYVSIGAVILFDLWQCIVVFGGLRKLYEFKRRKTLYRFSVAALLFTVIGSAFYLTFQSVPSLDFPGKRQAVLASEVLLLSGGVGFMLLTVLLCRHVRYRIRAKSA